MRPYRDFPVKRIKKNSVQQIMEPVAVETYHTIHVNEQELVTILCSPHDRDALTVGFLLTSGIITSYNEIISHNLTEHGSEVKLKPEVNVDERKGDSWVFGRIITTPCGVPDFWLQLSKGLHLPKCTSKIKVTWETLLQGTRALNVSSEIYRLTGGTHVAALFDEKGVLYVMTEDIGRHNAVDKAVGKAAILNLDVEKFFLAVSGRVSSDLISKMARVCIPLVASLTSPTSTGVQAADNLNITLVGFARGTRLNIYTHSHRVIIKGLKQST